MPTALQGGVLGTVPRGTLYPSWMRCFHLKAGEVSDVVKSEIGFHVLLQKHTKSKPCRAKATQNTPANEERARRTCQRAWLAGLANPMNPGEQIMSNKEVKHCSFAA
jgi:peptidylprolyl isomerase/peptidyl-prolyl cis-trans isomerase C